MATAKEKLKSDKNKKSDELEKKMPRNKIKGDKGPYKDGHKPGSRMKK